MEKPTFEQILKKAESYQKDMTAFLRDMIAIPSESCDEKLVVLRIKKEMEKVGFDKIVIDKMGNILGYIGHGKHLIGMDAHIDTVGIGEIKNWTFDPYKGFEDDVHIGGRGASDQEGGMASMVYAGNLSSKKTRSDQNSWFQLNLLHVRFIADIVDVWKSKSQHVVFHAMVALLKEALMRYISWPQSSKISNISMTVLKMINSLEKEL